MCSLEFQIPYFKLLMMKKLYLIRHAKSDWSNSAHIQDIDRPLNTRGIKNSYEMAERLKFNLVKPDIILSSNGIRALHTAIIFTKILNIDTKKVQVIDDLYHASQRTITNIIQSIDNNKQTGFIFCHNPGINDFANYYSDNFYENIPTCGILSFNLQFDNWEDWSKETVKFHFFDYPKNE